MIEWYMYVESGKLGYFNFLSDFAAANSKWALQAFIRNDSIFIDADGESKAKGVFTSNNWKKMQVITDLDDDFATFIYRRSRNEKLQMEQRSPGN